MARKKKAPTGLTSEELEALHAIIGAKRQNMDAIANLTIGVRNLENQIEEKINAVAANNAALTKLQEAYAETYGDVNINVNTGEFVESAEE